MDSSWEHKETFILLHTFEHMCRSALLKWWDHLAQSAADVSARHSIATETGAVAVTPIGQRASTKDTSDTGPQVANVPVITAPMAGATTTPELSQKR